LENIFGIKTTRLLAFSVVAAITLAGMSSTSQAASTGHNHSGLVCFTCSQATSGNFAVGKFQYFGEPFDRWDASATADPNDDTFNGGTNNDDTFGTPMNLTWSLVPDGTDLDESGEPNTPSDLIAFMDENFDTNGSSIEDRNWFSIFQDSYERWEEVSGITMTYESNDDGVAQNSGGSRGDLGVRGDLRVGGHSIDGQSGSNTLAFNYSPNSGDMVIDTDNVDFYTQPSDDFRAMRNVVMHEIGHGLGIAHLESSNSGQLMEPFINTSFDGPQFDDILTVQRKYGDTHEKNGGNDTAATATALGTVTAGTTLSIGTDATDVSVNRTDIDFISIDDDSDTDFLSFTLDTALIIDLLLTPLGPTYQEGPQGGT